MSAQMIALARNPELKAVHCLKAWGAWKRNTGMESLGWNGTNMLHRLRTDNRATNDAGPPAYMTSPESAVDRLENFQIIGTWVDDMLEGAPIDDRWIATRLFRDGYAWAELAAETDMDKSVIRNTYDRVVRRIKLSLASVRK